MNCERILNSWSIRKKLLLLLLIIFLPASAIIVASGLQQRENEIAKARNNASILVESLAAQQVQVATSTNVLLTTIAQMPAVRHSDAEACNIFFRQLQKDFPLYSVILAAATPDGNMFAASRPFKPGSIRLADRKHFKDAIETLNFSVGEYMTGRVSTLQSLNYTLPVLDDHKKPLAIIIAGFGLDEYAQFVSRAHMPAGYSVTIADWRGVRLFRSPETAQTAPGRLISPDVAKAVTANLEHGFIERINTEDQDTLYAFRRLRLNDNSPPYMYMLVGVSRAEILHAADLHMLGNLAILGVVAVIAMFLAWWFGDTVSAGQSASWLMLHNNWVRGSCTSEPVCTTLPVNWVSWLDLLMTWQCCWKKGFASAKPRRRLSTPRTPNWRRAFRSAQRSCLVQMPR